MSSLTTATPTAPQERMHLLDIISRLCLAWYSVNEHRVLSTATGGHGLWTRHPAKRGLITQRLGAVYTFVQGKFYTMFSLLFGMGFVLFLDRAREKSKSARAGCISVVSSYLAYIWFLFILSIFWGGDILLTYAIARLIFCCSS